MAKYYTVEVPVVMKMVLSVPAESEQEAIKKAMAEDISMTPEITEEEPSCEVIDWEWDKYSKIVQGNVFYGGINEPRAEFDYEEEEDEDEELDEEETEEFEYDEEDDN